MTDKLEPATSIISDDIDLQQINRRRLFWILGSNAALLVWLSLMPKPSKAVLTVDNLSCIIAALVASYWCLAYVCHAKSNEDQVADDRQRFAAWGPTVLIGAGILSYGMGGMIWSYYEIWQGKTTPFPSLADVAFVCAYPLLLAGIITMNTRAKDRALRGRIMLDGLMTTTALSMFIWYYVIGPSFSDGREARLGSALSLAYPIGDLMLLFCLVVLYLHIGRKDIRPLALYASMGLMSVIIADTSFAYGTLRGTYQTGAWTDVGWPLGYLLVGHAVVSTSPRKRAREESDDTCPAEGRELQPIPVWKHMIQYAMLPAAIGLVCNVLTSPVDEHVAVGVYLGCAILIALVLLRQVLTIAENDQLYRRLKNAYAQVATQNDRLQSLAAMDSMTGLANHGTFQERLKTEVELATLSNQPVGLIILDVDFFKRYNDMYGHPAGDTVLKAIAEILCQRVRRTDMVARYGGEEFAVILPGASLYVATRVAESIRSGVAAHEFENCPVTVSLGVTAMEAPPMSPSTLVERADQALYAAKHAGRNCVAYWDPCNTDGNVPGVKVIGRASRAASPAGSLAGYGNSRFNDLQAFSDFLTGPEGQMLEGVLAALDLRDCETVGHSVRVARFALRLAIEAGRRKVVTLHPGDLQEVVFGALLHDVGKIGVPDSILLKADCLTPAEWQVIHEHPVRGVEFLRRFPYLQGALPVVHYHHEWWDGSGYPEGLKGNKIPVTARIFAIADAFDAMTTDRLYRAKVSSEQALAEIKRMSGKQFDPKLVKVVMSVPPETWSNLDKGWPTLDADEANDEPTAQAA